MFTVTDAAMTKLPAFIGKKKKNVCIRMTSDVCCGARCELALDDPAENDVTSTINGITFCIQKALQDKVGTIRIDHDGLQFIVFTERTLPFCECF